MGIYIVHVLMLTPLRYLVKAGNIRNIYQYLEKETIFSVSLTITFIRKTNTNLPNIKDIHIIREYRGNTEINTNFPILPFISGNILVFREYRAYIPIFGAIMPYYWHYPCIFCR